MNDAPMHGAEAGSPTAVGVTVEAGPVPAKTPLAAAASSDRASSARGAVVVDDERLAAMGKALGHPVRVRILRLLLERETCMTGDLVAELPVAQSTVSEHLRILREVGLIQGEIEGPRTSYCVNRGTLAAFQRTLATF